MNENFDMAHKKSSPQNLACSQYQIHTVQTSRLSQAKTESRGSRTHAFFFSLITSVAPLRYDPSRVIAMNECVASGHGCMYQRLLIMMSVVKVNGLSGDRYKVVLGTL